MYNEGGVWGESKIGIEVVISQYFRHIFTSGNPSQKDCNKVTNGVHSKFNSQKVSFLDSVFVGEKVKEAVF